VEILDVGAGPLTIVGKKWPGREVHITPLDPNVDGYDGLLAKHGIVPPCRTVFGLAEELDFPEHSFDLVHARNSVDHSKDALQAIREMVRVVKKGCFVCLNHKVSEGRLEKYAEYHQWNLIAGGSSSSALECGPPM
jgi:ubiquinone/menaquinone biosynthesis C-methylase UbiE